MDANELDQVTFVRGDITDLGALEAALDDHGITNVIHLAALQIPFSKADPPLGARVNVVGTVNVFEAIKRRLGRMAPVVYASSLGMFAAGDVDPETGVLAADATPHPLNHYGVYKVANEGNARVYWLDDEVPSVGLRPMAVYGVGRDQGMTSGPTKAIASAVLGRPCSLAFGGPTLFQYADDVAGTLILASRSRLPGAHVFNVNGAVADGPALVEAIEAVIAGAGRLISYEPVALPFPSRVDDGGIDALGGVPLTPFRDGVRETIEIYRALARDGRLDPAEHGLPAEAPVRA
jgi:UDP-glucuronate 4-epimerase